jgi:hypothetical protein
LEIYVYKEDKIRLISCKIFNTEMESLKFQMVLHILTSILGTDLLDVDIYMSTQQAHTSLQVRSAFHLSGERSD